MHPDYSDIIERLGKPLWYYRQDVALPRYVGFHPLHLGIYDDVAALLVIRCQCCHMEFYVSVSFDKLDQYQRNSEGKFEFKDIVFPTAEDAGWFDCWGDPPRHNYMEDGCAAGDTMTSELVRVDQFWIKNNDPKCADFMEWTRHAEYEFDYSKQLEDSDA